MPYRHLLLPDSCSSCARLRELSWQDLSNLEGAERGTQSPLHTVGCHIPTGADGTGSREAPKRDAKARTDTRTTNPNQLFDSLIVGI